MGKNIAIFASGNGTNAENFIRYFSTQSTARVVLVLTNRQKAGVLERTSRLGVAAACFSKEDWQAGTPVLRMLEEYAVDFVVLAGFLIRVPDNLLQAYNRRMVNIHPSLLPKYGGQGMYGDHVHEAVLAAGEQESGITIHYTSSVYDAGAVICQHTCPVLPDDTPETLAQRVHALEYKHYPRVVERLIGI